ncbi:hypothetical protein Q7P37_010052 [Cladosporium fusiforme]
MNHASVSAAASPGRSAGTKHQRTSTRSKSASNSSVGTVTRGEHNPVPPMESQSPGDKSLIALRLAGGSPSHGKRRRSSALDPPERPSDEGLGNLNRWSQSTDASASSPNARRKRASSSAALPSLAGQPMSPPRTSRQLVDHSPRASPSRKPAHILRQFSPTASPGKGRRQVSNPINYSPAAKPLPTPHTTISHTNRHDTESPSTSHTATPSTSGLATPSTFSSYNQDYFGGGDASPKSTANSKSAMARNMTAPSAALNYSRMPRPEELQESAHRRRQSEMFGVTNDDSRPTTAIEATERAGERRPRTRERNEKDKKAMLSKALQKANTAVLLDNAQNFEAALEAYSDACRLLQNVMDRSAGAEDKRKLESIKITYTTRIEELQELEESRPPTRLEKGLPSRPLSDDGSVKSPEIRASSPVEESSDLAEEPTVIETARMTRIVDVPQLSYPLGNRDSFFSRTLADVERVGHNNATSTTDRFVQPDAIHEDDHEDTSFSADENAVRLLPPDNPRNTYMPAPLLPRKQSSPSLETAADAGWGLLERDEPAHEDDDASRARTESNASVSWLDTIDESGSSSPSVHSMSSNNGLHRKHIRNESGETDPDFDAAFDAAVEAAYNEGLEPDLDGRSKRETMHARAHDKSGASFDEGISPRDLRNAKDDLDDDEEEERILNEFTHDYGHGFNFDLQSKSALPRQSDSSGYSRSTWQSSQVSDRNTAGSSLSTVPETLLSARFSGKPASVVSSVNTVRADAPPGPPPSSALPRPPSPTENRNSLTVRSRRLSGQNLKQLRIETSASRPVSRKRASTFHHSPNASMTDEEQRNRIFGSDVLIGAPLENSTSDPQPEVSRPSFDARAHTYHNGQPPNTASNEINDKQSSEIRRNPTLTRNNKSFASLRDHHYALPLREEADYMASTPMSATFAALKDKRSLEPLTSQRSHFPMLNTPGVDGQHINGAYLFDTTLSASNVPSSPRSPTEASQPAGLEPCPDSFLLRPFWLMRAIGSSITHPRGGFVTTKLFVPRDVWQTRGVKLKSLDEKIANCDLLTAALGRIAGVDTYDADAVMEELQGFEEVMERVQATLVKKLGSEVGVHGAMAMFKDASTGATGLSTTAASSDAASGSTDKATKSNSGKSYLSSWRKLRNKSSGTPLSTSSHSSKATTGSTTVGDRVEPQTMASVPMTSYIPVERRGQKAVPNLKSMSFEGPQKDYMGSLARLVQGIAILDQIARQVEDPGLKHSSQTHVGLELSIRHAAEFFAFYVCRFVLADLGLLMDKFVKKGTEWALA